MKCPKCGQAFGKTVITRHKEKSIRMAYHRADDWTKSAVKKLLDIK